MIDSVFDFLSAFFIVITAVGAGIFVALMMRSIVVMVKCLRKKLLQIVRETKLR